MVRGRERDNEAARRGIEQAEGRARETERREERERARAVVPASPARSAATADVSWLACVSPLLFLKLDKNFSLYSNEPLVLYKKNRQNISTKIYFT